MKSDEANELTSKIIGCAMKVHREMGFGFLESVYENALLHELRKAGFEAQQQIPIKVYYDGIVAGDFIADLVVNGTVIMELKAVQSVNVVHEVQLVNYLKATGIDSGLLFNFGAKSLEFKRKHRLPKENTSKGLSGVTGLVAMFCGKLMGHF
jgi:GxxExxY protein